MIKTQEEIIDIEQEFNIDDYHLHPLNGEIVVQELDLTNDNFARADEDRRLNGFGVVVFVGQNLENNISEGDIVCFPPTSPLHTFNDLLTLPEREVTILLKKK